MFLLKIVEAEGSLEEENLKLRQELELMKKSLQESLQTIVSKEVQKIPSKHCSPFQMSYANFAFSFHFMINM